MSATDQPRISVGYVRRAHGVSGEVIVRPLTDNPDRYVPGAVLLTDESPPRPMTVERVREHKDGLLVAFVDIVDRNAAQRLQGVTLTITPAERRQLEDEEYWPDDLEGMVAIDPEGIHIGTVTGVVIGDAQDRLIVTTPQGQTFDVPFVEPIVGEVHPSLGHVGVDAPEGLLPPA